MITLTPQFLSQDIFDKLRCEKKTGEGSLHPPLSLIFFKNLHEFSLNKSGFLLKFVCIPFHRSISNLVPRFRNIFYDEQPEMIYGINKYLNTTFLLIINRIYNNFLKRSKMLQ